MTFLSMFALTFVFLSLTIGAAWAFTQAVERRSWAFAVLALAVLSGAVALGSVGSATDVGDQ